MAEHRTRPRPQLAQPSHVVFTQLVTKHGQDAVICERHSRPLVTGKFLSYRSPTGFVLHGGKTDECIEMNTMSNAPAGVIFTLLLDGKLEFGYDDQAFTLSAQPHFNPTGIGLVVNLKQESTFHRHISKHNHIEKLNIIIDPKWFKQRAYKPQEHCDDDSRLNQFLNQHLAHQSFTLNHDILYAAQQLISTPPPEDFLGAQLFDLQAQTLIHQLFEILLPQLSTPTNGNNQYPVAHHFQDEMKTILQYINRNLNDELSLEQIAKHCALSVSSLQTKFKQQLGMTVLNYVRQKRLEFAKKQLQFTDCTVTQAAYDAQYHHPANFTIAFKKAFGMTPNQWLEKARNGEQGKQL
ncbi:helix-turn-helix transcriptional regulator [Vibrio aphrogenes]|uniref:helix-turn-helix transcriptional regulator n=1 Tax=Vibrio aphrogenes TaxID=1891186 RepID=UPI000B34E4A3|nr:AraC family transcriptional regulator [Vibrio aphrogenes]